MLRSDDNGNLASDGQFRYYYDCESRLIDVNDANDAPVASYAYDYLGRRISRTLYGSPNVTIRYAYDGGQIIGEYDANDTLLRKFIYGPGIDEPICLIDVADNNAVYYYHLDGLGSVVALSDVNNVLVERCAYDVFGRPTIRDPNGTKIAESALSNPYLFTGRAYDAESGLYYYRARYYDYYTGRFLQPDPIGYGDGSNLYSYCGNNAVSRLDPLGLYFFPMGDEAAFDAAVNSLMGSATFRDTYEFLNNSPTAVYIDILPGNGPLRGAAASPLSMQTLIVQWHPRTAAFLTDCGSQSPALLLAHELEHIRNRLEGDFDATDDPEFGTVDERNVILGPETRIANQVGEGTRTSHTIGGLYRVANPTTMAPQYVNSYIAMIEEYVRKLLALENSSKACP